MQTVWAPAITTLLYLVIFTVAMGRGGRTVMGVHFADFIAPGLIVMGMIQNAFANASFSLLVGKMQGNDRRLSDAAAFDGRADRGTRRRGGDAGLPGRRRGVAGDVALAGRARPCRASAWVFWFGLMGALMLSFMGLLTSLWADKFDHAAAVTNFVVTPLSLLSGTFYSIDQLAPPVPGDQPRQPVLLRDLGLPVRLPRPQRFADRRRAQSSC